MAKRKHPFQQPVGGQRGRALALLLLILLVGCTAPQADVELPTLAPLTPAPATPSSPTPDPSPAAPPLADLPLPEIERLQWDEALEQAPTLRLDVELMYYERWMRVHQVLEMRNHTADSWDEVVFNVPVNYVLDAFFLDRVQAQVGGGEELDWPPIFPPQENMLRVPLPRPAQPGEAVRLEMDYRVVIPPISPADWPPRGTTGWRYDLEFDLIQAGEWYPMPVPYHEGSGWQTWNYHPVGDPTIYPLTNYELNIQTDEGVTIASGGLIEQVGDTWHFALEGGRGIAFIASDDYTFTEQVTGGITLRSYYLARHAEAGQEALAVAARSLTLFNALYGPYPYESLTVAENGFFGGMEYSGLITITDWAYQAYFGQPASVLTALVAHETAHQWWYGAVGSDQVNEAWLDESLAFYSELLYYEHYHPDFVDWWWRSRVDQYAPSGPVNASIYDYEQSADFILLMYGQAAYFMRDLRALMGDEAFFRFLQDYYRAYSGQIATGEDFFGMLPAYTEADLGLLLEQYFDLGS